MLPNTSQYFPIIPNYSQLFPIIPNNSNICFGIGTFLGIGKKLYTIDLTFKEAVILKLLKWKIALNSFRDFSLTLSSL